MNHREITPVSFPIVIILGIAVASVGCMLITPDATTGDFGLCIPSPNLWTANVQLMRWLNIPFFLILSATLYFINKRYGLLKSGQPLWASIFFPLTCSNLLVSARFTSAPLIMAITLIVMISILESYKLKNATRNLFFAASSLAIGSMFDRAFLIFTVPVMLAAIVIKIFRFREVLAILAGFAAPYWIGIGLGLISPDDFRFLPLVSVISSRPDLPLFIMLIGLGILLLSGLILTLNNGIRLYAGNSRIRRFTNVVNLFGIAATIGLVLDFDNYAAYIGIINMWIALQIANLFSIWNLRRGMILFLIIQAIILIFAICFILNIYQRP